MTAGELAFRRTGASDGEREVPGVNELFPILLIVGIIVVAIVAILRGLVAERSRRDKLKKAAESLGLPSFPMAIRLWSQRSSSSTWGGVTGGAGFDNPAAASDRVPSAIHTFRR